KTALYSLLEHYGRDVVHDPTHAGYGGRFYFVGTPILRDLDYPDPDFDFDYAFDLETDVCAEFAFCSRVDGSIDVKLNQQDCTSGTVPPELCGGWYTYGNDGAGGPHWGQTALNFIGGVAADTAFAHGPSGP